MRYLIGNAQKLLISFLALFVTILVAAPAHSTVGCNDLLKAPKLTPELKKVLKFLKDPYNDEGQTGGFEIDMNSIVWLQMELNRSKYRQVDSQMIYTANHVLTSLGFFKTHFLERYAKGSKAKKWEKLWKQALAYEYTQAQIRYEKMMEFIELEGIEDLRSEGFIPYGSDNYRLGPISKVAQVQKISDLKTAGIKTYRDFEAFFQRLDSLNNELVDELKFNYPRIPKRTAPKPNVIASALEQLQDKYEQRVFHGRKYEKLMRRIEEKTNPELLQTMFEQNFDIAIVTSVGVRDSIIKNGLTQQYLTHQTSGGYLDLDMRSKLESKLLGISQKAYLESDPKSRPVYGLILPKINSPLQLPPNGYGRDIWILGDKEKRAALGMLTWTPGDSQSREMKGHLDKRWDSNFIPWSFVHLIADLQNEHYAPSLHPISTQHDREPTFSKSLLNQIYGMDTDIAFNPYYEVQIWGGIDAKDLGALHYTEKAPTAEQKEAMQAQGIEWHERELPLSF